MPIAETEEQALLRQTVRRFLADRAPLADAGRGPMPAADWQALAGLGVLGAALPEAVGGLGGTPRDAAIIAEELGRALAVTPYAVAILGAAEVIACHGDVAQIERWIAPAMTGEARLALGQRDPDRDWEVPWGAEADAMVLLSGSGTMLLPADGPGLIRTPMRLADHSVAAVLSGDTGVAERIAGTPEGAPGLLAMVHLGHAAELVGIMAMLQDQTIDHVRQRQQFGVAIGSFQAIQHKLAQMFVRLEQARSMVLRASLAPREHADFASLACAAKAYVADAAIANAEDAVQVHGGMGVTDELVVGRALRRVMVLARLFGTAAAARTALAA